MGVATVPAWAGAVRKVRDVLTSRTVPLLAIFAAFNFTIMMFNVPVPGGTTAHGVGGTLVAIVLGPWAAVVTVSTALILQALFFGDGGILAIFANCFNMGVLLPVAGYWTYRLIAARAPLLSVRRLWAAAIGSYVGITVAALAVGIELGLQPLLFNDGGRPLYSPYGLGVAIPAMLLAHALGASIVEAIITALVLGYIQQHHPEYLTSLKAVVSGAGLRTGEARPRPVWQLVVMGVAIAVPLLLIAGLISGHGDAAKLFGADWSQVDWRGVGSMLLVTLVVGVVLVPLVRFLLPRGLKGIGTVYTVAAVLVPLGLIAPGFAFGEGSPDDLQKELGFVPDGLQQLSGIFSAPLSGYNLPLPWFNDANAPLWHTGLGYEIVAVIGILLLGAVALGLGQLLRRKDGAPRGALEGSALS
jgi:cobalt/nickel transport system permease protein